MTSRLCWGATSSTASASLWPSSVKPIRVFSGASSSGAGAAGGGERVSWGADAVGATPSTVGSGWSRPCGSSRSSAPSTSIVAPASSFAVCTGAAAVSFGSETSEGVRRISGSTLGAGLAGFTWGMFGLESVGFTAGRFGLESVGRTWGIIPGSSVAGSASRRAPAPRRAWWPATGPPGPRSRARRRRSFPPGP